MIHGGGSKFNEGTNTTNIVAIDIEVLEKNISARILCKMIACICIFWVLKYITCTPRTQGMQRCVPPKTFLELF